jgi:hypothetical protein
MSQSVVQKPGLKPQTASNADVEAPSLRLTKTWLEPKISHLDSSDQWIDVHWSNVRCSCFLAQASLFLLLVSFDSSFFAAIQP